MSFSRPTLSQLGSSGSRKPHPSHPRTNNLSLNTQFSQSTLVSSATVGTCSGSAFLELCVSRGFHLVPLGEIMLRDDSGSFSIRSDADVFRKSYSVKERQNALMFLSLDKIHKRYHELSRKGLFRLLYRPVDIHFVRFAVHAGGQQVGIFDGPSCIPPVPEVAAERYHYHECPLEPSLPIDRRTFFHFF